MFKAFIQSTQLAPRLGADQQRPGLQRQRLLHAAVLAAVEFPLADRRRQAIAAQPQADVMNRFDVTVEHLGADHPRRGALRDVDIYAALTGAEEGELVARRLAEVTGEARGSVTTGDGFWAVRRLLEALARERPLLLGLDDVH